MSGDNADKLENMRRGEAAGFLPRAMDTLVANVDKALEGPIRWVGTVGWGSTVGTSNKFWEAVTPHEAGELSSLEDGRLAGLAYRLRQELRDMERNAAARERWREGLAAERDRFLEQIESLHRRRADIARLFDERIVARGEEAKSYRDLIARGEAALEAIEREQERRRPATLEELQRVVEEQGRRLEELGAAQGKGLLAKNKAASTRTK